MKKASKRAKPARKGLVIDIHAHWFPPEWVELIEAEGNQNGARVERTEQRLSRAFNDACSAARLLKI